MATGVRGSRIAAYPVVVVAVVTGLLLGLAGLCCCLGEHAITHGTGRVAAAGLPGTGPADTLTADTLTADVSVDTAADLVVVGDPPDEDADRSGDGCGHPAGRPEAVGPTSGGALARDLAAAPVVGVHRPDVVVAGTAVATTGTAARAPASHLLCIMRT